MEIEIAGEHGQVRGERRSMTAAYTKLRHRLRASRAEIAAIVGRPVGTVSRWGHAGVTDRPVPADAIYLMRGALLEQAAEDAAYALSSGAC